MALEHSLALLIFVGRAGDVLSTLFVTPNMVLESNPIARRFKWPTMVSGFALCALPYFDVPLAIMVAVASLMVTASNLSRGWMARALGEGEMEALYLRAAARSSIKTPLAMAWLSAIFTIGTAGVLVWLADDDELVRSFAIGLAVFGLAVGIHSSFFFRRIFRQARGQARNAA